MQSKFGMPRLVVEQACESPFELEDAGVWAVINDIAPLWLADGSAPARQFTRVRVCFDETELCVRFDCEDDDIWGTYTERDEPIYEQEVVEVFLGVGVHDPIDYFEFEVSPNGVLFDATIHNPTSTRQDLRWDSSWNCEGVRWMAQRDDARGHWWAALAIPWRGITDAAGLPPLCRANFYRIERPRERDVEYSCWSPTMTNPADFHKPARFGILEFSRTIL